MEYRSHLDDIPSLVCCVVCSGKVDFSDVRSGPVENDIGVKGQTPFLAGVERYHLWRRGCVHGQQRRGDAWSGVRSLERRRKEE